LEEKRAREKGKQQQPKRRGGQRKKRGEIGKKPRRKGT